MNNLITPQVKVKVSGHAVDRYRQRFGNRVFNIIQDERSVAIHMIREMKEGNVLEDWERVPFYANMVASRHGINTKVIHNDGAFFMCQFNDDKDVLAVRTVVPHFLYYPSNSNSVVITSSGGARWMDKDKYEAYLFRQAKREAKEQMAKEKPKKRLTRW